MKKGKDSYGSVEQLCTTFSFMMSEDRKNRDGMESPCSELHLLTYFVT